MTGQVAVLDAGAVGAHRVRDDDKVVSMWLHGRGPNTRRAYTHDADRFAAFVGMGLQSVAVEDVQGFADELEASGLSAGSQGRVLAAVKSLLTYAHKIGHTTYNVGAVVSIPQQKDTLNERILPRAKIHEAIASTTNPRDRLLLRVLYASGARVSEVSGLCWHDVQPRDDDGGQLTLFGKGNKTRTVRLPAGLYRDLEAMRAEPDAPVFPGRNGALTPSAIWRVVKVAGKRIGEPGLSPHWFRHATASHALDAGATIAVVRDTLGHANLSTTSRYSHSRPGDSAGMYLGAV